MSRFFAAIIATCALVNPIALAQNQPSPPPKPRQEGAIPKTESEDERRAKLLGVLMYTKLTMKFEETPVREVIEAMAQELGTRIIGRYSDEAAGFGLDPEAHVSIDAVNQDALSVLEEILDQCSAYDQCTWQLRKGYVEVSTKERLSVPGAREVRTYHIRDLMIEPAYFEDAAFVGIDMHAYCNGPSLGHSRKVNRKRPEDLSLEILGAIIEVIEPGMWEVGTESRLALEELGYTFPSPPVSAPPASRPPSTATPVAPSPTPAVSAGTWASIRIWRDQLIVRAPDFMHQQIDGYPKPIPPETSQAEPPATPSQPSKGQGSAPGAPATP
ncbi:MAG: hypothetical protein L0Y44_01840 [Phycisphaerales bacterium]|nr:hypothetical protein [Phycisphaerales bacterium]MCI0676521.1 hypothetical protein [Phycisphaerales bacterium]